MGPRKDCLLENEILVNAANQLREELFKDFSKNLLEKCPNCSSGLDEDASSRLHKKLISTYVDLSDIKKILQENQNKKDKN